MNKKIIGLVGLAGSGKDTAAMGLIDHGYFVGNFAGRLKWLAELAGWDFKKDDRGRKFLQDLGSVIRAYNPSYFIDWLEKHSVVRTRKKVVISDVRFQNEAEYVRSHGGIIVRIHREGIIPMEHESELKQSEIVADYTINNDSTPEALINKLVQIALEYDKS